MISLLSLLAALVLHMVSGVQEHKNARLIRTPNGGLQPQAVVDGKGMLHLIYFKGEPRAGDIFYVRRPPGQEDFSTPLRVNSRPGSAIAIGAIRGGQIAIGKAGRVHIVWNGSGKPEGMFYARLNDASTQFEPQRNLMRVTTGLDGGGTVAADNQGNVYVGWHGVQKSGPRGEENRQVWLAKSTDDGHTFADEIPANTSKTGACACCSMRAFADRQGSLYMLYRSAAAKVNRDIHLLASRDSASSFHESMIHKWRVPD